MSDNLVGSKANEPPTFVVPEPPGAPALSQALPEPAASSCAHASEVLLAAPGNRGLHGFLKKYGLAGLITGTDRRSAFGTKKNERRTVLLSELLGVPLLLRSPPAPATASSADGSGAPLLSAPGNRGLHGFLKKYGLSGVITGTNRRSAISPGEAGWNGFLKRYGLAGSSPRQPPADGLTGLKAILKRYGLAGVAPSVSDDGG